MGIRIRVDDDTIDIIESGVDLVDDFPFVVALEYLHENVVLFTCGVDQGYQIVIGLGSINFRFPNAQHVDARSVDNENFHKNSLWLPDFLMCLFKI